MISSIKHELANILISKILVLDSIVIPYSHSQYFSMDFTLNLSDIQRTDVIKIMVMSSLFSYLFRSRIFNIADLVNAILGALVAITGNTVLASVCLSACLSNTKGRIRFQDVLHEYIFDHVKLV